MESRRFGWVVAFGLTLHAGDSPAQASVTFPAELRGLWDSASLECNAADPPDSDLQIKIGVDYRHHDEDRSELVSIVRISNSPKAWRVRLKSGLIDGGDALFDEIYVNEGDSLVITNGDYGHVYDRCK